MRGIGNEFILELVRFGARSTRVYKKSSLRKKIRSEVCEVKNIVMLVINQYRPSIHCVQVQQLLTSSKLATIMQKIILAHKFKISSRNLDSIKNVKSVWQKKTLYSFY